MYSFFGREWRALWAALRFLTRIPAPFGRSDAHWRDDLARAPRYFPLVGGLIGAITGGLFWALCQVLPATLAAALALAVEALLTGAFHEDALADYCDAFGGGATPERIREILKDSRLGSYGALGLGLGVLIRWSALVSLQPAIIVVACMAAGAIGRAAALVAMRLLAPDPARASLAKDIGAQPSWGATGSGLVTMVLLCLPAYLAAPASTAIALVLTALPLSYLLYGMHRKLGGVTGDGLGAIAFIAQALALVAFSAEL